MKTCTLIFDIDGTLCPIKKANESYSELVPYPNIVEKIRDYKEQGVRIVLFSSRNMKTYNGNLGEINKNTAPTIIQWLSKWDIPYDEIYFGKPWPGDFGFYIDDRSVRPDEFLGCSLDELNEICIKSRERCN